MKRTFKVALTSLVLAGVMMLGGGTLVSADTVTPSLAFGEHVSMMGTEGHPLPSQHGGAVFGGCVSDMTRGGTCPDMP